MSMDLRPLSLGELLDRSFTLFRRHFITLVGIMAVPAAVGTVIGVIFQVMQGRMQAQVSAAAAGGAPPDSLTFAVAMLAGFVTLTVLGVVYWAAYTLALGATSYVVSELYLGRTATVGQAYGRVRPRIGGLLLVMVLLALRFVGMVVLLGALLGIVGFALRGTPPLQGLAIVTMLVAGMFAIMGFMLRYALSVPALVLENIGANQSIRRSVELVRGSFWRVVVLMVFATIIAYISVAIFQGPLMFAAVLAGPETATGFWLNMGGAVLGGVAGAISGPIMIVAFALLYYDVRIRQEGLDVQIMMAMLPPSAPGPTVSPDAAPFAG